MRKATIRSLWRAIFCTVTVSLSGLTQSPAASPAEGCAAAVEAARAEWRELSRGIHQLAPSHIIITGDGPRLSGAQINYARVLIRRAETACEADQVKAAIEYVDQINELFHPDQPKL